MSKQDDMRRLIDLANGKKIITESQSEDTGSVFKRFNEAWGGEPASEPTSTRVWQDTDPLGDGKWFWTRAVDGHVVARGGNCDTEEEADAEANGMAEDLLAEPAVLDEDDFHNDNEVRDDSGALRAEIADLVADGFFVGSGGGHEGSPKFVWSLDVDDHIRATEDEGSLRHIASLIGQGHTEGHAPEWKLFIKTWHDNDFAEGLDEEDHEFEDSYFNIDEKDDLARIAWLIHDGQDQGFGPEWSLTLSGREVLQGGLPNIKPDERNAIAQAVRAGKFEGMLHTGEKWTVHADLELNETIIRHAPSKRGMPDEVPQHVKGSKFVADMEAWQSGKMTDEEFHAKWDGRPKTAVDEEADSELEYENEPDDGHEHEWVDPDFDMGVPNAVMCSKCGEMSVDDEDADHRDDHEHEIEEAMVDGRRRGSRNPMLKGNKELLVHLLNDTGYSLKITPEKRDGWNDSRKLFAVAPSGEDVLLDEVFKGDKADWDYMTSIVMKLPNVKSEG